MFVEHAFLLQSDFTRSQSISRWVEEHTSREVSIVKLGEWSLLFEILLNKSEVLMSFWLVEALICGLEGIEVGHSALTKTQGLCQLSFLRIQW